MIKKPKKVYRVLCATCDKPLSGGVGGVPPTVAFPDGVPYNHKVRGYDCESCTEEKRVNPPPPPSKPLLQNMAEIVAVQKRIEEDQKLIVESIAAIKAAQE